jgi:tetrapyrrole methylase family protein/MazG family protein
LNINSEEALRAANRKFEQRFLYIEDRLRERGKDPGSSTLEEMDALWEEAKGKK